MERSGIKKSYVCFNVIGVIITKLFVRILIFLSYLDIKQLPKNCI